MTLQQYLKATAGVPAPRLRQAMAEALTVEPARTAAGYRRFYRRVIDTLAASGDVRVPAARTPPAATDRRAATAGRGRSGRARRISTARPCAALP